jgi:hypothetical protein
MMWCHTDIPGNQATPALRILSDDAPVPRRARQADCGDCCIFFWDSAHSSEVSTRGERAQLPGQIRDKLVWAGEQDSELQAMTHRENEINVHNMLYTCSGAAASHIQSCGSQSALTALALLAPARLGRKSSH